MRLNGRNAKFVGHPLLLQHFQTFPQQQKRLEKYARLNWLQLLGQRFAGIDDCNNTQTSSLSSSSSAASNRIGSKQIIMPLVSVFSNSYNLINL